MKTSLTQLIEQKESLFRDRWRTSAEVLRDRVELFQSDSPVFAKVHRLVLSVIAIVENKESAEQAVDAQLRPIVFRLREIQSTHQLSTTEMVILLFLMRNVLREMIESPALSEGTDEHYTHEALRQASSLMNRLGLVFFENAMRLVEEDA